MVGSLACSWWNPIYIYIPYYSTLVQHLPISEFSFLSPPFEQRDQTYHELNSNVNWMNKNFRRDLLISFWRTHLLFGGHWYPCFGFLVASPLGFKARVGSALFVFCRSECNVHSLRSTYGATLADLSVAGAQPVTSLHAGAELSYFQLTCQDGHDQIWE